MTSSDRTNFHRSWNSRGVATGICVSMFLLSLFSSPVFAETDSSFDYPKARQADHVDEYHGQKVPDPYRWLEDADSKETRAWIEAENKITFGFLEGIEYRQQIQDRLAKLWNYERYSLPSKKGGRYFISKNDGLQNQSVLYTMKTLDGTPKVLLDPNKFSTDGTVALSGTAVSDDGKYLAYGTSTGGSDWQEWHVRDIETGKDLDDHIKWIKFSSAQWSPDSEGFYYSRYDAPKEGAKLQGINYYQKLYYHKLGTPQSEDKLIYERKDQKEWGFGGSVTDDGKYLIISVWRGTERKNLLFYKDLTKPNSEIVELINEFEASYSFVDNKGSTFWLKTDYKAPKSRVIAVDVNNPSKDKWNELIPASRDNLRSVSSVGGHLIGSYLSDARSVAKVFDYNGKMVRKVDLPDLGSVSGFGGKASDSETFYKFTNFIDPGTIYRYDVATGKSDVYRKTNVQFDPNDYKVRQLHVYTDDQTRVPIFVAHLKGIRRDGNNPTYLYGYGGFNIPVTPSFRMSNLLWMEMGGIYVSANIRGGGEFGREWHQAGTKLQKQNCFNDFIAVAEFLIKNNLTSADKLAIGGGSNGGLLVGACMTQRPDLFGAAVPAVGVLDMLRFEQFTIGWAWTSDYGSVKNEDEFKALYAYSPLHNLKSGTDYPATLILTGDHDDRVVPAHSFKFAAALQAAHGGEAPTMIRIQTNAGHGAGKPTTMVIEEAADKWAFLAKTLGMKPRFVE